MFNNLLNTNAQANLANQLQAFVALTHSAFDGGTKILELNLNLGKARLEQSSATLNQLLLGSPQEFLPVLVKQARQNIETALSHYTEVTTLLVNNNAEITRIVNAKLQIDGESDIPAKPAAKKA